MSVTPSEVVENLIAAGMEPRERAGKHALYAAVLESFAAVAGTALPCVWWVPGRLEVFGKHTDYAGGRTLVCAVPRGFAVAAAPRRASILHKVEGKRGE